MSDIEENRNKNAGFVRLGGVAILAGLAIHIIVNVVLKTFPSEEFTLIELRDYLSNEAGTWAIVHGMRYVAIVCIIIFSAGLFMKVRLGRLSTGWGIVGLLGTVLMMANLLISNGIEILAFYSFKQLSEQKEFFWLLFHLTRVLFTAEIGTWAILIFGFSMAGMYSSTIPKWLIILGFFSALTCIVSSVFIVSILKEGWASYLIEVASLTGLLWFICIGFYMMLKKDY